MKKIVAILVCILSLVMVLGVTTKNGQVQISDTENLLRIHIRANSNTKIDQNIKYEIKDKFVDYLTPLVCDCESKQDAIKVIKKNKNNLKKIADDILSKNNFEYESNIKVTKEFFPTRQYENYTVTSGVYDSIIVELGDASGNNWWCVIYPPLCFTNFTNSQNVVYKSKIMEIINKYFGKE